MASRTPLFQIPRHGVARVINGVVKSAAALCALVSITATNAAAQSNAFPDFDVPTGPILTTEAEHAVIMDHDTGLVLFSKNADRAMPPASMSKIMTVLVVFDRIKAGELSLDDTFIVSDDAWRRGGFASRSSTMCLEPGEEVSVADLLRGVIILSGNDAAITFAENLAGSEPAFAELMNARAEELGLSSATFANATGWPDPNHRISARDLAEIARVTINEHPALYAMYAEQTFDFCTEAPSNRFNRNPLLGEMEGVDGMKTGRTSESGFGLVASRVLDGQRRIIVYNGLDTARGRARAGEALMRAAFSEFHVVDVFAPGDVVGEVEVFFGEADTVTGEVRDQVTVGYHRTQVLDVEAVFEFETPLRAPVTAGDEIGQVTLTAPGREAQTVPVYAAQTVLEVGRWDRIKAAATQVLLGEGS